MVNLLGTPTVRQSWGMNIAISSKNHRFPVDIISHAVWLSCRICLSFPDVEALLLEPSMAVTDEAIYTWCRTCGQMPTMASPPSAAWRGQPGNP